MKILCFFITFLTIILQFIFLPVLSHADQVLSSKNRTVYINAPDTIIHVKVEDEGKNKVIFGDWYSSTMTVTVKGWVCGRNLTEDTLKIVSRLNMATQCLAEGYVNLKGSVFQTFDNIKDAYKASKEIIERAKKGYGDVFEIIGITVFGDASLSSTLEKQEINFNKLEVKARLESSDPDNYTATYRIDDCYTESDIKKLVQARVDAANALIAAYENWLKKRRENLGIK